MSQFWALTVRELRSFWYSPIAYGVGAAFLFFQGWTFWLLIAALNDPRMDPSWTVSQVFFGGWIFFWVSVLFTCPMLTMRTFSEEKRSGTIEFLLTTPVTDAQVVLAKFFGAWLAYCSLWAFTLPFFLYLSALSPLDWGPVASGYLGTFLLGGVLIAIGIFASSLTRNQIIAFIVSLTIVMFLWSLGLLSWFIRDPEQVEILRYLSIFEHLSDFGKGIVDTRPIAFYLSVTAIFLFLTGRVISSPRWRS